jgi:hypothetical protein
VAGATGNAPTQTAAHDGALHQVQQADGNEMPGLPIWEGAAMPDATMFTATDEHNSKWSSVLSFWMSSKPRLQQNSS